MQTKPEFQIIDGKKLWLMPDGEYVPYLAGGNDQDSEAEAALNAEKEKVAQARGDAAKYREKLRTLEENTSGFDADEYKALKEAKAKSDEDKELAKGNYEKLLSEKTSALETELNKNKEAATSWKSKYENKIISDSISASAKAAGAINADDVQQLVSGKYNLSINDEGKIQIKDGDTLATDGEGNPITVDSAIKKMLDDRPYLVKSADAGAGANKGTSKHSGEKTKEEKVRDGLKKMMG